MDKKTYRSFVKEYSDINIPGAPDDSIVKSPWKRDFAVLNVDFASDRIGGRSESFQIGFEMAEPPSYDIMEVAITTYPKNIVVGRTVQEIFIKNGIVDFLSDFSPTALIIMGQTPQERELIQILERDSMLQRELKARAGYRLVSRPVNTLGFSEAASIVQI